jgi:hypothetical protein
LILFFASPWLLLGKQEGDMSMRAASAKPLDPRWAWAPYVPSGEVPWNLQRVGHLYRRASFGATWKELQQGLELGPAPCIDQLLKGGPVQKEFEKRMAHMAASIARANNAQQLPSWWLYRILYGPHPLLEKITLFWHNHFATSNAKVKNAGFMLAQYDLLRKHALGNFAEMLREITTDRAMLVWLDTAGSKKGNPNENYARELMELFSLGIGNYTEADIREAARAFTGYEIQGSEVVFRDSAHDEGTKTVLGQKGNWKAEDIVRICLEQKACARFIVSKLYRFLISETEPASAELIEPLAREFRSSGYDFRALLKRMLSSNLFFSERVYRTRIKAPVDFVTGIVRPLEARVGTTNLAAALSSLGQNLFNPPSVKGWDGGRTWLNGQTLLFRQNLALALTSTEDFRFNNRCDPAVLAKKYKKTDDEELVDFFLQLFLQGDVSAGTRQSLLDYLAGARKVQYPVYWSEEDIADHRIRSLCHLVLTQPEFQLD